MPSPLRRARTTTVLAAIGLVLVLAACSPEQDGPSSSPSPVPTRSAVSGSPDAADLRGRLALGLQDISPVSARLVTDPETALNPVPAAWLPGWQILDVQNLTGQHPRRFYVALADDNQVVVLTAQPAAFSSLLSDAGVSVTSADTATDIAAVFLDSTRNFVAYSYRIDGVDDIEWRPTLTAEQSKARDQIIAAHGKKITPATAEQTASGWTVSVWTIDDTDLVRHEVSVAANGAVSDKIETVATDLPVPASR